MEFQTNRTAAELISEIKRIDEAMLLFGKALKTEFKDACSSYPAWQRRMAASLDQCARFRHLHELLCELGANYQEDFLALIKEVGARIDPETAETVWVPRDPFDPYGIYPAVPSQHITELCFVDAPDSRISIWIGDLPDRTGRALRLKLAKEGVPLTDLIKNRADVWEEYRAVRYRLVWEPRERQRTVTTSW